MKTLKNLRWADSQDMKRTIVHGEMIHVGPHAFRRTHKGHAVDVQIVEVSEEESASGPLLRVVARVWRDGVEVQVDNPLFYLNAPMLVHDGTFEIVDGERVRNLVEDPQAALQQIVFDTLTMTALK